MPAPRAERAILAELDAGRRVVTPELKKQIEFPLGHPPVFIFQEEVGVNGKAAEASGYLAYRFLPTVSLEVGGKIRYFVGIPRPIPGHP